MNHPADELDGSDPLVLPPDRYHTVIALLPSSGLGGGIERYCEWLLGALGQRGACVTKVVLRQAGTPASIRVKVGFMARCAATAWRVRRQDDVTVLVCHPGLALSGMWVMRVAGLRPSQARVVFYGEDIWPFGRVWASLIRRIDGRFMTISSFSSGAVSRIGQAAILPPGIDRNWYNTLRNAPRDVTPPADGHVKVLTVFRLDSAVEKGLPELLSAVESISRSQQCSLTVAGFGALPLEIATLIAGKPWVSLVRDPSDNALAALYAKADVFVLATRTTSGPPTSGEGFGIVLVEAQLAGVPVIAPAHGGSDNAFLDGITGLKPSDESAESLEAVLRTMLSDSSLLRRLGDNARTWARAAFDPGRREREVAQLLLGPRTAEKHTSGVGGTEPLDLTFLRTLSS